MKLKLRDLFRPLRTLTRVTYEGNVILRLEALGVQRHAAGEIVTAARLEQPPVDLERVVSIVTFLVAGGWARPGLPDEAGLSTTDIATALAFCFAADGGRALADWMAPADFQREHLDQWVSPAE